MITRKEPTPLFDTTSFDAKLDDAFRDDKPRGVGLWALVGLALVLVMMWIVTGAVPLYDSGGPAPDPPPAHGLADR